MDGGQTVAGSVAHRHLAPMLGPQSDDPTDYNEILDKAKALIDALLSSYVTHSIALMIGYLRSPKPATKCVPFD